VPVTLTGRVLTAGLTAAAVLNVPSIINEIGMLDEIKNKNRNSKQTKSTAVTDMSSSQNTPSSTCNDTAVNKNTNVNVCNNDRTPSVSQSFVESELMNCHTYADLEVICVKLGLPLGTDISASKSKQPALHLLYSYLFTKRV
jgi:hypothetical protein